jgi:hypothetical protein
MNLDPIGEDVANAELQLIHGILESVPEIKPYVDQDLPQGDEFKIGVGMIFMEGLRRVCRSLVNDSANAQLLKKLFGYLESLADKLDIPDGFSPLDRIACDSILFTFTDNPTGHDPMFVKLSPFMGPKIREMCTI